MSYAVKELFFSQQGEGQRTGRDAVFLRFSGCNLWSGREADRPSAICRFCDTDFRGTDGTYGGVYDNATSLADVADTLWRASGSVSGPYVILTGGEPTLQADTALIEALHARGFEIAIETNGTLPVPAGIDWITVSPKAGADLVQTRGDELKLVYPQPELLPTQVADLDFEHFFLQPMDGPQRDANTELARAYCEQNAQWKLSIQTHKLLGIR